MKPILFNTEMVRAILENRKTATRLPIKDMDIINGWDCEEDGTPIAFIDQATGDSYPATMPCPYHPSDILYVRETWAVHYCNDWSFLQEQGVISECTRTQQNVGCYVYRADGHGGGVTPCGTWPAPHTWHPSIHMPREAARIFLQKITDEEARREGCENRDDFHRVWNDCYSRPQAVKTHGIITHYRSYPWEDILETKTYRGKPWYVIGNPWVWVIEFERISREAAE